MRMESLCRTCLKLNGEIMEPIFDYNNNVSPVNLVSDFILQKLNISIDDGFPQQICSTCSCNLLQAHTFWYKCIKVQEYFEKQDFKLLTQLQQEQQQQPPIEEQESTKEYTSKSYLKSLVPSFNETASVSLVTLSESSENKIITKNDNNTENIFDLTTKEDHPIRIKENKIEILENVQIMYDYIGVHKIKNCVTNNNYYSDYNEYYNDYDDSNNNNHINEFNNQTVGLSNCCNVNDFNHTNANMKNDNAIFSTVVKDCIENNNKTECKACGKYFPTEDKLIEHILYTHKEKRKYIYEYKKFCIEKYKKIEKPIIPRVRNPKIFICDICNIVSYTRSKLLSHMKRHQESLKCTVCGKEFARKQYLRKHYRYNHVKVLKICSTCGMEFTNLCRYEYHSMKHRAKKHRCKYCDKLFFKSDKKRDHERIHTGERPYLCNICGKDFRTGTTLNQHMYVHTVNNKNICLVCNRHFRSNIKLSRHMKTHNGICNSKQMCVNDEELKQHTLNAHIRPSVIVESIKSTINNSYNNHNNINNNNNIIETTMDELKLYPCNKCGQEFRHINSLNEHLSFESCAVTSTEKPFKCDYCENQYLLQYNLRIHINIQHANVANGH